MSLPTALPQAGGVTQIGASVGSGLAFLTGALGAMQGGGADSPLASLSGALGGLKVKVTIDTGALTADFPATLQTLSNALAPSTLDFIAGLSKDFDAARGLLADSALARAVADGRSLQEVALAGVQDALAAFDAHRAELLTTILPAAGLAAVADMATLIEQLASDYPGHAAKLPGLVSGYLIGASPDLLAAALEGARQPLQPLEAWSDARVAALVGAPLAALQQAQRGWLAAMTNFDPGSAAAFDALDAALDAVQAATPPLCQALAALAANADAAIEALPWDRLDADYAALLTAIPFDAVPVPADAVAALSAVLEGLLAKLEAQLAPSDLVAKIDAVSAAMHLLFSESPLGQVREAIRAFLTQLVAGIDAVPTDKIGATVRDVLGKVGEQVQKLGLQQVGDRIDAAFAELEAFVVDHLNDALGAQVEDALKGLLDRLNALPLATLVDNVEQLIAQLAAAIDRLKAALDAAAQQLADIATQLDQLSFKPAGDAVVSEIDALRTRLAAINPDALSEVEKVALQAALAVVRAVDLEGKVDREVKQGFDLARDAALNGLGRVAAVLKGVQAQIEHYQPGVLLGELVGLLEEARRTVDRFDGRSVLRPVRAEVDRLAGLLDQADPGRLLQPLEAPFQSVLHGVEQLDPDALVAPLNAIYARIDALIDQVDVGPLLVELDRREQALLGDARQAIIAALDAVRLPAPLDGFYALVKPVLEGLTGALLADPATELQRVGLDLSTRFKPSTLFEPLDAAWAKFVDLLAGVPSADLEAAFEAIRLGLGTALPALEPRRITSALKAGRGGLAAWSPRVVLGGVLAAPAYAARFELQVAGAPAGLQVRVVATRARLAGLAALADTAVEPLITAADALDTRLGRRIAALDVGAAEAAYGRLVANLGRVLPDWLAAPAPLTAAEVLAHLRASRPSAEMAAIDALFARFQARVAALGDTLAPSFAGFFNTLREPLRMLSPLSIRDDVAAVYTALRDKVRVIDPAALATELHAAVYDPVHAAVAALDPAALGQRLNVGYAKAVAALTANVARLLDTVAGALDTQLQRLKQAVDQIVQSIEDALKKADAAFAGLLHDVEHLVFVDILARLEKLVKTLAISFDREVDRVVGAFDQMLAAIPLKGGAVTVEVSTA